ncbi:S-adenosyl-L-methionine-dependent methyltransferases superfamily protein isoform 1 [Tripterygium wilfordii]|uniref:S-adenosyl-L-methionine-dependent methyltransferases superfamily protein isoform 1 n=2 Tax=Tripterygium wilfordii TaxID=458696 RepID=A0A7J7DI18_TRIWF|nr:S-adenosyl-L-methionine-dependent methyltransferases superfamily protein isoform 1 [Tripterygium wilfordii]
MKRRKLLSSSDSMAAVDRISHLPEPLIHHVMSYLPRRDAARISAVSHKFKDSWYSFPIVDYDIRDWKINTHSNQLDRGTSGAEIFNKFINDVYDSLQFRSWDISWHELRLRAPVVARIEIPANQGFVTDELVNMASARELIVLALQKNVKSIDVCFGIPQCSLPAQLFSARSITVLKLDGCKINQSDLVLDRSFSVVDMTIKRCSGLETVKGSSNKLLMFKIADCTGLNQINISSQNLHEVEIVGCRGLREIDFKASRLESFTFHESRNPLQPCVINIESCNSMKKLTLEGALITNGWIRDHLSKFPLLEFLGLRNCYAPRDLYLKNDNVFKVTISDCYGLENIIVMASNLEYFKYYNRQEQLRCKFDIRNPQNLKSLILYSACVTDQWLEFELPLLFPLLERLKLSACGELRKIKTSHANLKTLELYDCSQLEEAEFRVPKLSSFVYRGGLTSDITVDAPYADVKLFPKVPRWIMSGDDQIYVWWEHLRQFLGNFGHSNKLTLVCPMDKLLVFPKEFRETLGSPLHDLKRLEVTITQCSSENFVRLLDSLLWLAPRLNTVSINFGTKEKTLKFIYDKRATIELKDELCYCRWGLIRCWRHYLTEVRMENFDDGFEKRIMSNRPELLAPPEIYYDDAEACKYTSSSRIIEIQAKLSERALELLALPDDGVPRLLLDIGCGSGLSGETPSENGHQWIGLDISQSMLDVALEQEVEGDLLLSDMGQGLPLRTGVIDGAISISAIQWLCNVDKTSHEPRLRLKAFFGSLYRCLSRGAKAAFQMYPENVAQRELILSSAMRAGFAGGVVVDYPHSSKMRKEFVVLTCGPPSISSSVPQGKGQDGESCSDDESSTNEENQTVCISDRHRPKKKQKVTKKGRTREWVLKRKEKRRRKGNVVPLDTKHTGWKRKARF